MMQNSTHDREVYTHTEDLLISTRKTWTEDNAVSRSPQAFKNLIQQGAGILKPTKSTSTPVRRKKK